MGKKRLFPKMEKGEPSGTKPEQTSPRPPPSPPIQQPLGCRLGATPNRPDYPRPGHRENPYRVLSSPDRATLVNIWSEEDLQESLNNGSNEDWVWLENIFLDPDPVEEYIDDLLDIDRPGAKLRWCSGCHDQGVKEGMIKCRACHQWFHDFCEGELDRVRDSPSNFKFWKCSSCQSGSPKNGKDIHTLSDIERDEHFEDTDNEMYA